MSINFSVIIAAYNSQKWIGECLNSIISQDMGFEDNIEIIIVDDASFDNTHEICRKYIEKYPDNIQYIKNEKNNGPAISRNNGLKHAKGKYVNFLDSDDKISKQTFKNVLNFFKKHDEVDVVSIPIYFFENRQGSHYLNDKFQKTQSVNLIENPECYQLSAPSSFIKSSAIKNIHFPNIITSEDVVFVNEILINNPNIGLCCEGAYYYRKRQENTSIINNSQLNKDYYTPRVKNYFKYLIKKCIAKHGCVLKFIQNVIMYDISWMLKINNIREILDENEILDFKKSLSDILQCISDDIILNYKFITNTHRINAFLLKYGSFKHEIFSNFKVEKIFINIYQIVNNELYVLANLHQFKNNSEVSVFVNGKEITTNKLYFPQKDRKYLDYTYLKDYSFDFKIPLTKDKTYNISFAVDGRTVDIDFKRHCNFSKTAGYAKTKDYISTLDNHEITVEKKTTFKWVKREFKTLIKMIKNRKSGYKVGIPFRLIYFLLYPLLKNRHIWFFMDRPEVADDNGKYLFEYAVKKDPEIEKYFIVEKNTKSFNEIAEIGEVIGFKSIKHRILGMFAENIVSSHPDSQIIYPFWGSFPHLAGLLKSNNVFLQHGIIKDDISTWLNKQNMNLAFFLTSATLEYESILKNPYNYDENIVKLLGLPRYDSLKNDETKRQIIIMPSWRRNLNKKSEEYILKSEFYKTYNSLINSEKLIDYARKNNYKIIFKPHPNVYKFIHLFSQNEYVQIADEKITYQDVFNKGSLLITDYSSVAFDFAYLKKPVLYYHYSDDYHFDLKDSYFDYETMGFGEVVKKEDELINLIIEYINNDCKIKKDYLKRINEFFLYTDKNNCKRVYDAIKDIPLKD